MARYPLVTGQRCRETPRAGCVGQNTVPDGKYRASAWAEGPQDYRSRREKQRYLGAWIPFSTGSLTVPAGKEYRSRREALPYPRGRNTVLDGKPYRTRGEGIPYPRGTLSEVFPAKKPKTIGSWRCACLCLCINVAVSVWQKGRKGFGQRRTGDEAI